MKNPTALAVRYRMHLSLEGEDFLPSNFFIICMFTIRFINLRNKKVFVFGEIIVI
jgi:hypothetical protein